MRPASVTLRSKIHLAAIALTFLCIAMRDTLPEKRVPLHPVPENTLSLYSDNAWGGKSIASWVEEPKAHWSCQLRQSQFYPVCGFAIAIGGDDRVIDQEGVNFKHFHSVEYKVRYNGEAPKLRFYLRNHNSAYSDINDDDSYKFNSFEIPPSGFKDGIARVKLSEFTVAKWWLEERQIDREHAAPEFNNIVALGMDLPAPHVFANHDITVESIDLIGQGMPDAILYQRLLLAWLTLLGLDAVFVLLVNRKRADVHATEGEVTEESKTHKAHLITERQDFVKEVEQCYLNLQQEEMISLIFIHVDLDDTSQGNDELRHKIRDEAMELIQEHTPENCILTRWEEETILLLYPKATEAIALQAAQNIVNDIAEHPFQDFSKISAFGGVATNSSSQPFMQLLQHASDALYQAKQAKPFNVVEWQA